MNMVYVLVQEVHYPENGDAVDTLVLRVFETFEAANTSCDLLNAGRTHEDVRYNVIPTDFFPKD